MYVRLRPPAAADDLCRSRAFVDAGELQPDLQIFFEAFLQRADRLAKNRGRVSDQLFFRRLDQGAAISRSGDSDRQPFCADRYEITGKL
jgi:hypothetical protein